MTLVSLQGTRTPTTTRSLGSSYRLRARYDWVAVDLITDGGCLRGEVSWRHTALRDKAEAIRRLATAGLADSEIAARIGITDRTVLRIRQDHKIPAALTGGRNAKALVR